MPFEVVASLKCDGQDHMLRVERDEDGYVYFNVFVDAFYAGQVSFLERWRTRLAIIFNVLRGREYLFEEIVVAPDQSYELAKLRNLVDLG